MDRHHAYNTGIRCLRHALQYIGYRGRPSWFHEQGGTVPPHLAREANRIFIPVRIHAATCAIQRLYPRYAGIYACFAQQLEMSETDKQKPLDSYRHLPLFDDGKPGC